MNLESHLRELGNRHNALDQQILEENKRPNSDPTYLKQLKREKLRLKEEIETLRRKLAA